MAVLLYKYLHFVVNTKTEIGLTVNINYNTDDSIMMLMMILLILDPNL